MRYGVTRNQVYAVQIVTPYGDIVDLGSPLKKCSTATAWSSLLLAVRVRWVSYAGNAEAQPYLRIKLICWRFSTTRWQQSVLCPQLVKAGIDPTSIEYMDNPNVRTTSEYLEFPGAPHVEDGIYVIITIETFNEDELDMKMEQASDICEAAGAVDVLEADERIWSMRRNCLESVSLISKVCTTDDVVVPVDEMSDMIQYIIKTVAKYPFPLRINAHIGDGNLHIVLCKLDLSDEEWESELSRFTEEVYTYAYAHGGRLSGEHGIGSKKAHFLERFTPSGELELMRKIKKAWDPNNILNPGKVFNL